MAVIIVGVDSYGRNCSVAKVDYSAGRPVIQELQGLIKTEELAQLCQKGPTNFAVADSRVMVKKLRLRKSSEASGNDLYRFELIQSLADDKNEFCLDVWPTGLENHALGFVTRRNAIEQLISDLGLPVTENDKSSRHFQSRALALGKGYLSFCIRARGDFLALLNVADQELSICLLYRNQIVAVSHLSLAEKSQREGPDYTARASELKTVVNFLKSSLLDQGVTVPVSGVILCGPDIHKSFEQALDRHFPGGVSRAKINPGFLNSAVDIARLRQECFVVALGMTVD